MKYGRQPQYFWKWKTTSIFSNGRLPQFSSSWVQIRLHTENKLPGLPGSALKVYVGWWWWGGVGSTWLCGHTDFIFGLKLGSVNDAQRLNALLFHPCYERKSYSRSTQEGFNAQHHRISNLCELTFSLLLEKFTEMKVGIKTLFTD